MQSKQKNKQPNLVETCTRCGKTIKRGSITAWIFSARGGCNCFVSAGTPDKSVSRAQVSLDSLNQDKKAPQAESNTSRELSTKAHRYKLDELIGAGGMGSVYKAVERELNKTFAVKLLRSELAQDNAAVRRFQREVKAVSSLTHPNLVAVYDFGFAQDGNPFLVMDYVEGHGLDSLIQQSVFLEPARVVSIFLQVVDAIAHAHSKRVIHRDIKPSNILVITSESGLDFVKLVDFGIAKILSEEETRESQLTQTGEIFGSPYYMSPEQCLSKKIDERSDIYSIGCVMYEALCGKPPLQGENPVQTILMQINELPADLVQGHKSLNIPEPLSYVVMRCLEKDPAFRYQSVEELGNDLKLFKSGAPLERVSLKRGPLDSRTIELARVVRKSKLLMVLMFLSLAATITALAVAWQNNYEMELARKTPVESRWSNLDVLGQEAFDRGDYQQASKLFDESLALAESSNNLKLARASMEEQLDLARATGRQTEEKLLEQRLKSLQNADLSHAHELGKELDAAITASGPSDCSSLASRANDLTGSLIEAGHFLQAENLLTKTSLLTSEHLPPEALERIRTTHNSAYLAHELGETQKAWNLYDTALSLEEKRLQSGDLNKAQTLLMMARLAIQEAPLDSPRFKNIRKYLDEALSIYRTSARRDKLAECRYHCASYYLRQQQEKEALKELEAALTILLNLPGAENKSVARCYSLMARVTKNPEQHRRAIELFEKEVNKDFPSLIQSLCAYSHFLEQQNRSAASQHLLQRALCMTYRLPQSKQGRYRLELLLDLAKSYRRQGDFVKATEFGGRALELARAGTDDTLQVATITMMLGEFCDDEGNASRAREYFAEALKLLNQSGKRETVEYCDLRTKLSKRLKRIDSRTENQSF